MKSSSALFLNSNISARLTGIEHSSLLRASIFLQNGLERVFIVTFKHNERLDEHIAMQMDTKRYDERIEFVSIWDLLLGFVDLIDGRLHRGYEVGRKYRSTNAMEIVYDEKGTKAKVCYFGVDGELGLVEIVSDEKLRSGFYIVNNGTDLEFVGSEQKLYELGLSRLVKKIGGAILAVVDRNEVAYVPAIMCRQELQGSVDLRVVSVIHSTHYKGKNSDGAIKSFYAEIFDVKLPPADGVVVLSSAQLRDVTKRISHQRVHYIPHAVGALAKYADLKRDPRLVVYVARLSKEKRHIEAIDIFAKVLRSVPDARLEIYGIGEERKKIIEHIERLRLGGSVKLMGYAYDVYRVFASARVSISTSSIEAFGLFVLESLSMGCPCVAYGIKYGLEEIIEDGKSGFVVRDGDSDEFARRVVELLSSEVLHEQLSSYASLDVAHRYSVTKCFKRWSDLYEQMSIGVQAHHKEMVAEYASRLLSMVSVIEGSHKYVKKVALFRERIVYVDLECYGVKIAIDVRIETAQASIIVFGRDLYDKGVLVGSIKSGLVDLGVSEDLGVFVVASLASGVEEVAKLLLEWVSRVEDLFELLSKEQVSMMKLESLRGLMQQKLESRSQGAFLERVWIYDGRMVVLDFEIFGRVLAFDMRLDMSKNALRVEMFIRKTKEQIELVEGYMLGSKDGKYTIYDGDGLDLDGVVRVILSYVYMVASRRVLK
ncbi:MAG: glycosyltransferase [Sulfuricurvum sp.]